MEVIGPHLKLICDVLKEGTAVWKIQLKLVTILHLKHFIMKSFRIVSFLIFNLDDLKSAENWYTFSKQQSVSSVCDCQFHRSCLSFSVVDHLSYQFSVISEIVNTLFLSLLAQVTSVALADFYNDQFTD